MNENIMDTLHFNHSFLLKAEEFIKTLEPNTYCMVAIDIEHFRLFNKMYGREAGDELMCDIADCLQGIIQLHPGLAGYMGGDNFSILMPDNNALLTALRDSIIDSIRKWNNTIGFLPIIGAYTIDDVSLSAEVIYDRATLAMSHISGKHGDRICRFEHGMETKLEEEIQLLADIQTALDKEEFTFFAQPQCDIATGKIIGAEALVRWKHSTKGMIPPGVFIPVLEKNGIVDQLDRYVWKKVCQWLRSWIDRGYTPVPISINASRIDILSMDVPAYLEELLQTYNLPERLVKVEITESAYAENNDAIDKTVQELRQKGFKVLMDDFGSGYSSLNMLKNISVDVIKLDMRFLDIDEANSETGIGILESIVNIARLMHLPIIVEGVETETQEKFLQDMGCRYTQGYYYYKPLPLEQFEAILMDERRIDLSGLLYKQVEPLHIREFLDNNFISDIMLNNVLGPIAFYDQYKNQIEITRVNEQYFRMAGSSSTREHEHSKQFWNHVRDDDRPQLYSIFEKAYEHPADGSDGYLHFMKTDGTVLWVYLKVFFLKEKDGHRLFYGSLTDMTALKEKLLPKEPPKETICNLTEEQLHQLETHYKNLPCGYAVAKLRLNAAEDTVIDFEPIYGNQMIMNMCNGDLINLKSLAIQAITSEWVAILEYAYNAGFKGQTTSHHVYSNVSGRYLEFTFYQYSLGYVGCVLHDITHTHIYKKALKGIMQPYREVYFVHLTENYYRMLYPDDSNILERGNYEETASLNFYTDSSDNSNPNSQKFFSLENLKEVLKRQDTTEYIHQRSIDGVPGEWCLTRFTVSERDADGEPKIAIMIIQGIDALMHAIQDNNMPFETNSLVTMSKGFFIYHAVEEQQLLYASSKVLQLYGCDTIPEFMALVNYSFRGMIHPDDYERVVWEINDQVTHSTHNMDHIQYRIIRKDGQVRWVDDFGHLENDNIGNSGGQFYVFISDITDTLSEGAKTKLINQSKDFQKKK